MNEKKELGAKAFFIICIVGIICGAVATALLPFFTFRPQKYMDLIAGLAKLGTSKSGELFLYKGMLAIGVIVAAAWIIVSWRRRRRNAEQNEQTIERQNKQKNVQADINRRVDTSAIWYILGTLIAMHLGLYMMVHAYSLKLIYFSIIGIWMYFTRKERWKKYLLFSVVVYYALTGVWMLTVVILQWPLLGIVLSKNVSQLELLIAAFLVFFIGIFLVENKKKVSISRCIMMGQLLIPFNLLVYLRCEYLYAGEILFIPYTVGYTVLILGLLTILEWEMIRHLKIQWEIGETEAEIDPLITKGLILVILVLNSFIVPAQIIPSDTWHHGEQVTQWQQVVDLGQGLYSEFFPSSGNFSMPIGVILRFLCGNTGSGYPAAYSLVGVVFALLVGGLLIGLLTKEKALLLVALSGLPIYDRGYLILPTLLLLLMPKLISDRSKWLKVWIISCLLGGLYYPTFGAATLIATMPFGMVQAWDLFKTGEWDEKKKKGSFWIGWAAILGIVISSAPLLMRMAKYILGLANYSLETDSLTLLGNGGVPAGFFIWLPDSVRLQLYLFIRIMIPMMMVLLPAAICLALLMTRKGFYRTRLFFGLSAAALLQIVAYSYTLLRADSQVLCSRTYAVILPASQMLYVILMRQSAERETERQENDPSSKKEQYLSNGLQKKLIAVMLCYASMGFICVGILNFPNTEGGTVVGGLADDAPRLASCYRVSEVSYTRLDATQKKQFPQVGEGFIQRGVLKNLIRRNDFLQGYGIEDEPIANYTRFLYYLDGKKACYGDSTVVAQSAQSQRMIIEQYEKHRPIIWDISVEENYEIVKWMEVNGYCTMENGCYMPAEMITHYGMEAAVSTPGVDVTYTELGKVPAAWGTSMETLKLRFDKEQDISASQDGMRDRTDGFDLGTERNYDYLYIELESEADKHTIENTQQVILTVMSQQDEILEQMSMEYGEGAWLIPLGYSEKWRHLSMTEGLYFKLETQAQTSQKTELKIKEAKLLESN